MSDCLGLACAACVRPTIRRAVLIPTGSAARRRLCTIPPLPQDRRSDLSVILGSRPESVCARGQLGVNRLSVLEVGGARSSRRSAGNRQSLIRAGNRTFRPTGGDHQNARWVRGQVLVASGCGGPSTSMICSLASRRGRSLRVRTSIPAGQPVRQAAPIQFGDRAPPGLVVRVVGRRPYLGRDRGVQVDGDGRQAEAD